MGLLSSLFRGEAKHTAAMNALVAKHVFSQMGRQQRQEVCTKIQTILSDDGHMTLEDAAERMERMDERVFFGFAAIAMAEIGIVPPKVWSWQVVHNPFVALVDAAREIEIARIGLHKRAGINVSLA